MAILTKFFQLFLFFIGLFSGVAQAETKTILIIGDSLSAAHGLPIESGWVHLLEKKLTEKKTPGFQIINISTSGNTTSNGLSKLEPALAQYQPHFVIIALGSNDGLRAYPIAEIFKNLEQMILLSQAAGSKPILLPFKLPPNYGAYAAAFENVFLELRQKYHLSAMPFLLEEIALKLRFFLPDRVHPNEQGQIIMFETIWQPLWEILNA